jgi:uncharacterized coiled-coil protein SlyX
MDYDPTKPVDDSPLDAAEMRGQLNSLKALIDAQAAQITAQQGTIDGQQAQIAGLLAQIDNINSNMADMQDAINALQGH